MQKLQKCKIASTIHKNEQEHSQIWRAQNAIFFLNILLQYDLNLQHALHHIYHLFILFFDFSLFLIRNSLSLSLDLWWSKSRQWVMRYVTSIYSGSGHNIGSWLDLILGCGGYCGWVSAMDFGVYRD